MLGRERRALLRGALDEFQPLLEEKQALIQRLENEGDQNPPALRALREKILRNQELLSNAKDGIRAVNTRLAELRRLRAGLETYDRDGRRARVPASSGPSVEKRV